VVSFLVRGKNWEVGGVLKWLEKSGQLFLALCFTNADWRLFITSM
jgi:hypothetical protein